MYWVAIPTYFLVGIILMAVFPGLQSCSPFLDSTKDTDDLGMGLTILMWPIVLFLALMVLSMVSMGVFTRFLRNLIHK